MPTGSRLMGDYFFQSAHKMPTVIKPIKPCDPKSATIAEMLLITPSDKNGTAEPNTTSKAIESPIKLTATAVTEEIVSVIVFHIMCVSYYNFQFPPSPKV